MSSRISRRAMLRTGLAAAAGASGLAAAAEIARRYGLIPPDYGGLYGIGETLTYGSHRVLMLLGAGGIVSQAMRGGGLYTLSLPVSRQQIVAARAGVALLELLALAAVPAVIVTLLSPAVDQSYSLADGLVHAALLFGGGAVFFSFTFLMSSIFTDIWRPPAIMRTPLV